MRGLPFPQDAAYNREQSHEFGTPGPASTPGLGDISLDPALAGHATASIFIPNGAGPSASPQDISPMSPSMAIQRYAQGPQGDPFAPQPPPYGYPNLNSKPNMNPPPKPAKRKRRPRREEICGFCGGNDSRNKGGDQEPMVTCDECGRSGHPSCMALGEIGSVLLSYPWKCAKCKSCEICHEKGADGRMLFCDRCDRGWHMDCLDPPVQEAPEGSWYCPLCSVLPPVHESNSVPPLDLEPAPEPEPPIDPALQMDIDPALREMSVASSSHQSAQPEQTPRSKSRTVARGRRDRKGKGRAVLSEEEDEDHNIDAEVGIEVEIDAFDEDIEGENMSRASTSRRKSINNRKRGKGRPRRRSESVPDDGESPGPPLRPPKRIRLIAHSPTPRPRKTVRLRLSNQKGKGRARDEEEEEEGKKGLFDDILSIEDRDTMKTSIMTSDKERFDKARNSADSKLAVALSTDSSHPRAKSPEPSAITGRFPLRSVVHQLQRIQTQAQLTHSHPESPSPSTPGPSHKFDPNVLRIRTIRFGPYDIQTWYDAPFPEEFSNIPDGRLWICEFCLKYMKSRFGAQRHRLKCKCRHPPGDEIYRDGPISIFEVDGRRNKIYCQNLCLLSKMFLDHKSLFYDVEPFLFYVMTEVDDIGARFVGYFSKEKRSPKDLNLSCIMTLPVRQRQGWGNLLIDFSYLLSKKEQKSGTPERPLSALGAIGYKKYWTLALMRYLQSALPNPRLEDISTATAMSIEDIYNTLLNLNMITVHDSRSSPVRPSPGRSIKLNRRKVGIARRNLQKAQPKDDDKSSKINFAPPTDYDVHWDKDEVDNFLADWESKGYLTLNPDRLKWTPFLLSRNEKQILFQPFVEDGAIVVANTETPQASGSGSAAAESNKEVSVEADVFVDSPQIVDSPMDEEAPNGLKPSQPADIIEEPKILKLGFPSSAELEGQRIKSPTPMPTPTRVPPPPRAPKPRSSTNGLEALAAVAVAVSKANPTPMRRKSSSTTASPNIERNSKLNGDLEPCLTSTPMLASLKLSIPTQSLAEKDVENVEPRMKVETPTPLELMANGRSHALDGRFPISSKRTQSMSPPETTTPDDVEKGIEVEKDAELAVRLAHEDSGQRRSLRSLHPTPPVTMVNTKDVNKDYLRKRRKAASPISDTSPLTPLTPDRPTTRAQAHAQALETARSSRLTRSQSTRLSTNGSLANGDSQTPSGLRTSSRLNGVSPSKSITTPTPLKPVRVRSSTRNEDRRETENRRTRKSPSPTLLDDDHVGGDADAEGESDVDAEGEPDVASGEEVKDDEMAVSILSTNFARQQNGHISNHIEESALRNSVPNTISTVHPGSPTLSSLSFPLTASNNLSPSEPPPDSATPQTYVNGLHSSEMGVEDEDPDAEGEPDDEDAEGELDTEMYQ